MSNLPSLGSGLQNLPALGGGGVGPGAGALQNLFASSASTLGSALASGAAAQQAVVGKAAGAVDNKLTALNSVSRCASTRPLVLRSSSPFPFQPQLQLPSVRRGGPGGTHMPLALAIPPPPAVLPPSHPCSSSAASTAAAWTR